MFLRRNSRIRAIFFSVRSPDNRLRRPCRLCTRENASWILMKLDSGFWFIMNRVRRLACARKRIFWICSCVSLPRYRLKWIKKSFRSGFRHVVYGPIRAWESKHEIFESGLQRHWNGMERQHNEKCHLGSRKDELRLSYQRAVCRMPFPIPSAGSRIDPSAASKKWSAASWVREGKKCTGSCRVLLCKALKPVESSGCNAECLIDSSECGEVCKLSICEPAWTTDEWSLSPTLGASDKSSSAAAKIRDDEYGGSEKIVGSKGAIAVERGGRIPALTEVLEPKSEALVELLERPKLTIRAKREGLL